MNDMPDPTRYQRPALGADLHHDGDPKIANYGLKGEHPFSCVHNGIKYCGVLPADVRTVQIVSMSNELGGYDPPRARVTREDGTVDEIAMTPDPAPLHDPDDEQPSPPNDLWMRMEHDA